MHKGPINLPDPIKFKCLSLINLGNMLQLFSINLFVRVMDVRQKIDNNTLLVHDLQDIVRLCDTIKKNSQINEDLKKDITELHDILELFINVASFPTRNCGLWSAMAYI